MDTLKEITNQKLHYYRGRIALKAILDGLNISSGDKVLIQAFTCVAVPEAIIQIGAIPIYIDVKRNGFNIDPYDLASKITIDVKAIIVQHTYGIPADMDEIMNVSNKYNIPIIEDCCHSFDSYYKGKKIGTFGMAAFYSYEWGKPLVIGVGGSALINDTSLAVNLKKNYIDYKKPSNLRVIRILVQYIVHKLLYKPTFYWKLKSIFNSLSSLKIAEGNYYKDKSKLSKDYNLKMSDYHQRFIHKKAFKNNLNSSNMKSISKSYFESIDHKDIIKPNIGEIINNIVLIRFPIIVKNKYEILDKAKKNNIEVSDWYSSPIHPLKEDEWKSVFYEKGSCPNAENLCNSVVSLPIKRAKNKDVKKTIDFFNNSFFN